MRESFKNVAVVVFVGILSAFLFISGDGIDSFLPEKNASSQTAQVSGSFKENLPGELPEIEIAVVSEILDGDSFIIENGDEVRLIGVDAPELSQPFALESKDVLESLILGKEVGLEKDETDRDRYGRLLRYVYVDGVFVNLEMVRLGYANIYSYPPDTKYEKEVIKAEEEAKEAKRGFWDN